MYKLKKYIAFTYILYTEKFFFPNFKTTSKSFNGEININYNLIYNE